MQRRFKHKSTPPPSPAQSVSEDREGKSQAEREREGDGVASKEKLVQRSGLNFSNLIHSNTHQLSSSRCRVRNRIQEKSRAG